MCVFRSIVILVEDPVLFCFCNVELPPLFLVFTLFRPGFEVHGQLNDLFVVVSDIGRFRPSCSLPYRRGEGKERDVP